MHKEAYEFVRRTLPPLSDTARVLEIGSYDVNGSIRSLFPYVGVYVGVDIRPGPGVDIVAQTPEGWPEGAFDVVVSTETLEHADDWGSVVRGIIDHIRPGGIGIITCAATGRPPHSRDGKFPVPPGEPYYNLNPWEVGRWLWLNFEVKTYVEHRADIHDLYLAMLK